MAKKKRQKTGMAPGSVIFTGRRKVERIAIHYLEYNEQEYHEQELNNQSITSFHKPVNEYIQWYDARGLHDTELIEEIGKTFDVHPLALEDIADPHQRPKFDEYENGNFITIKVLKFDIPTRRVSTEQVSIYFGKGFLLSFQEDATDVFAGVRQRLYAGRGRLRKRDADYLAYALLDEIVDNYFVTLDDIESVVQELEDDIIENARKSSRSEIHSLKREMIVLRKSIAPLREAVSQFSKSDSDWIEEQTSIFIRDLYDHTIQIMDMVDTYRDVLTGLQDLYISEISFRMNSVMQVLTIITTIFVPLSFLAGLYGMNFDNIPELHYENGYFILLAVMFTVAIGLLIMFRKKKWI